MVVYKFIDRCTHYKKKSLTKKFIDESIGKNNVCMRFLLKPRVVALVVFLGTGVAMISFRPKSNDTN